MEYITVKIDISFPSESLKYYLNNGWEIHDKTVVGDRYIYYILSKEN